MAASAPAPTLPDVVLGPSAATSAVIVLHGLGDTSAGWVDTVSYALLPSLPSCRFILPSAPTQAVTINGGNSCPSWYDIESLSANRSLEKCAGLEASVARVQGLVAAQHQRGIPHDRIALAGFSQGGALALFTGLTWPGPPLAGVFTLSGYLPRPGAVAPSPAVLAGTPVRLYHGDEDGVVPLAAAHDAEARCRAMGCADVRLTVFPGLQHSANERELAALVQDLRAALTPRAPPPTPEGLAAMSAKELKAYLVGAHAGSARIAACLEKSELVALALEVLAAGAGRK